MIKSNNDLSINTKIKIYTGYKLIILDNNINKDYQIFRCTSIFNFDTTSQYRIGFKNACNGMCISIKDITFQDICV